MLVDGLEAALPVQSPKDQAVFAEMIKRMNDLGDQREARLLASRDAVPLVIWSVLMLGAMCTVGFTFLFGLHNLWAQIVMTIAPTGIMALVLFVVIALDNPFSGDVSVKPDAMEAAGSTLVRRPLSAAWKARTGRAARWGTRRL